MQAKKKKRLQNLATDEKDALRPYIANKKTVHQFIWSADSGIVTHLEKCGLLSNTRTNTERSNYVYVSIDLWTYGYLRKRPELVGIKEISN